ncbi:sulfur carrier protein ThiS [Massilia sp. W12]|uniref:sulfur carrier protein ThiS n=1 Tax=Massilia sp. W12 TaxID=3126507 RepID=UPI0030D5ED76
MMETIAISLNGQAHQIAAGSSCADLMRELGLEQQALALAVNRQVAPRAQWAQRQLCPGDQVDIVKAIGGG